MLIQHSTPPPDPELIRAEHIGVQFGGHQVLTDVRASVRQGETVALLGGNGSGKTTLVRALMNLVPHTGEVTIMGEPQRAFKEWDRLGYVPQRGQLQMGNATVREVVASGRLAHRRPFMPATGADKAAVTAAIQRTGLADRVGLPFSILSGGQQQRALIARALAAEPDLLVLDEPLAALDIPSQHGLARLFEKLTGQGLGMLVVLHELGAMERLIDRSIVLRDGRVIHDGPLLPGIGSGHHHDETPDTGLLRPPLGGR